MKIFYDLHIHSALSPCADDDMTPNNIVHMAQIKGLQMIAVTDHNAAANLAAVEKIAQEEDILLLPGIELNTAEEVHMLAYFPTVQMAEELGDYLYEALPEIPNIPQIFGNQWRMDEEDEVVGSVEKLLISALPFSVDECVKMVRARGGVIFPAHYNKSANSMISNLGMLLEYLDFQAIEVFQHAPEPEYARKYQRFYSSDAHQLGDISECIHSIDMENRSRQAFFQLMSW